MSLASILNNLLIGPLELLFEVIYARAGRVLEPGWSIVALSLAVNLLVLPLYRRADAVQRETRETETRLSPWIRRIRAAFRGDEQYFMLRAYYRQNRYSPLHTLKSALPLLLQIPFFIAAYQFLRQLGSLRGASFGPISDLGAPDGLLTVGGAAVNLLPLLMTAVNLLSGALYTRNAPRKDRIQLAVTAAVFLALLYNSPAGLTLYWTLNNLFSLCKNLIQKLLPRWRRPRETAPEPPRGKPNPRLFALSVLALTLLMGLMIPSAVISASPQEFFEALSDPHPAWYVVNALLLAAGTFLVWFSIYYALAGRKGRRILEIFAWIFAGLCLINYFFFRSGLGRISNLLVYDTAPEYTISRKLMNLGVLAAAAGVLGLMAARREKLVRRLALTLALAMCGMGCANLWTVCREVDAAAGVMERNIEGKAEIPLSRNGKNVVVLMLDRAISSYLPCILSEKPGLKDAFPGFVYYPNTLSHGMHTNLAAPGLFGGYEYTPREMNARDSLSLQEKHNEALLLMPTLFSREGYGISLFDLPYPGNYSNTGDYSVFDSLPNTNARVLCRDPDLTRSRQTREGLRMRNFFCYSLSVTAPDILLRALYDGGGYNRADQGALLLSPNADDAAGGYPDAVLSFLPHWEVLDRLGEMTRVQEEGNTLLVLANETTHSPVLLREPDYVPGDISGNAAYDESHRERFLAGPYEVHVRNEEQMAHYHANMAALLKVGEWLEELKAAGVYDNTRIIIVSDHGGMQLFQVDEGIIAVRAEDTENELLLTEDICGVNPLLMVKDFGAEGEIRTDTSFMTNADVPSLAMEGLVENPVNPFTGNPVGSGAKREPQYVSFSQAYDVTKNRGNRFNPAHWFAVTPGGDTLFDASRWIFQGDDPR